MNIMTEQKPTLEELRITTGLYQADFLRRAGVSTTTYHRIKKFDPNVNEVMLYRCLNLINELKGTNYTLNDIKH